MTERNAIFLDECITFVKKQYNINTALTADNGSTKKINPPRSSIHINAAIWASPPSGPLVQISPYSILRFSSPHKDLHMRIVVWVPVIRNFWRTSAGEKWSQINREMMTMLKSHTHFLLSDKYSQFTIGADEILHSRLHVVVCYERQLAHVLGGKLGLEGCGDAICGVIDFSGERHFLLLRLGDVGESFFLLQWNLFLI